jgi:hypothetical protein
MSLYRSHHPGVGLRSEGVRGRAHVERLERMLDLSSEQKRQVDEILRESHAEGERLHAEMLPRVHEHMERTRERIEEILTPGQRELFTEMAKQHRGRLERFFLGEHGPPPPHSP